MSAQPGWYTQPDGSERYWDGQSWTQHTRTPPAVARFEQPPPPPDPVLTSGSTPPFYKSKPFLATAAVVAVIAIAAAFWGGGGGQPATAPAPTVTATVTVEPTEPPPADESPPPAETTEPAPSTEPTPSGPAAEEAEEETETFTMPKVVGMNLQYAQDLLQSLGSWVMDQEDASGLGRMQVVDSNWKVCTQSPKAGKVVPVETMVTLGAVKLDEECP